MMPAKVKVSSFTSVERRQWLTAVLMTAVLFAATFAFCRPLYETNDDSAIVAAASGAVTGSPYAVNGFTSYVYGLVLSRLFALFPSIPWHACILLGTLFFLLSKS